MTTISPPPFLLKATASNTSVVGTYTDISNPYHGKGSAWSLHLNVTPKSTGYASSNTPYAFNALDISVGDWIASSSLGGRANQIISIVGSVTATSLTAIVNDPGCYNASIDTTKNGNGLSAIGTVYIFRLGSNGFPILTTETTNIFDPIFGTDLLSRFFYTSTIIGSSSTSGSINANIISSTGTTIVNTTASSGSFISLYASSGTFMTLNTSQITNLGNIDLQFGNASGGTFQVSYYNNFVDTSMFSVTNTGVFCTQIKEQSFNQGTLSGSVIFDLSRFSVLSGVITSGSVLTISFSNYTSGFTGRATMILQNAGLAASISYGSSGINVLWEGGLAPTYSTSGIDIISFFTSDGITWFGSLIGRGFS
jgi:hypothetical protein